MNASNTAHSLAEQAAATISSGIGRRGFAQAVAGLVAGVGIACTASCSSREAGSGATPSGTATPGAGPILQPGTGTRSGDHYLSSDVDRVLWGYVPTVESKPVLQMGSGQTVTIDTVSHEGILEDQGRNPVEYFGTHGVAESDVLQDAVDIASGYNRTPRNFDVDGPHVVTGPIFVEGAVAGDVLKIETLEATPRVPYGVVSSRPGSTFYLPVFADGALFYVGDPHMAMGDGEVALTAMEGALRGTFRLTVCKKGSGDAPSVAYLYPFAENKDSWIPIGLSDPDGAVNGQGNDLNVAPRGPRCAGLTVATSWRDGCRRASPPGCPCPRDRRRNSPVGVARAGCA